MYGNPTFWSLPVATAALDARAAVFLVAYDMLTQPRIAMAIVGALLLGVAWPQRWLSRDSAALAARGLALHFTLAPALLALATLAGIALPGAVWILVLGPLPLSTVSFAQMYGYSARTAAGALALSVAAGLALAPLALALSG